MQTRSFIKTLTNLIKDYELIVRAVFVLFNMKNNCGGMLQMQKAIICRSVLISAYQRLGKAINQSMLITAFDIKQILTKASFS